MLEVPQIVGVGGEAAAMEPASLVDHSNHRTEVSTMVTIDCIVVVRCVEIAKLFLYYSYVRTCHHVSTSARSSNFYLLPVSNECASCDDFKINLDERVSFFPATPDSGQNATVRALVASLAADEPRERCRSIAVDLLYPQTPRSCLSAIDGPRSMSRFWLHFCPFFRMHR